MTRITEKKVIVHTTDGLVANFGMDACIDIRKPESVEITSDGKNLWVNIDGICRLRVYDCAGKRYWTLDGAEWRD